ncbi:MAG TPA: hypothetical protein V6D43_03075 [Candidatus Sericytochromatia bacterium]
MIAKISVNSLPVGEVAKYYTPSTVLTQRLKNSVEDFPYLKFAIAR